MESKHESSDKPSQTMNENKIANIQDVELNHPDINRVFVAGSLLHDPPLRRTRKGVPVTNFIVVTKPDKETEAEAEPEREPVFVSVVVWAKQAVQCSKHLRKGSSVIILGELQSMPNAKPEDGFFPIQISAQWIQYLEKGKFNKISIQEEEEFVQDN